MIQRIKHFFRINWYETLKINLTVLSFKEALILPIVVYNGFKINEIKGEIKFNVPLVFGLITFGHSYEVFKNHKNSGEARVNGIMEVNGSVQFGLDTKLFVKEDAVLILGHINSFASRTELICFKSITFGSWVQFGNDCLITDSNFHELKNSISNEIFPMNKSIVIGSHNFIGVRTTVKGNTITPNYCTVASNSLLNKDYLNLGENILIGGISAKLLKENIVRDWESEKISLENYLTIKL